MESQEALTARYDEVAPTYEAPRVTTDAQRLYWMVYEHLTWKPVEALLPLPAPRIASSTPAAGVESTE